MTEETKLTLPRFSKAIAEHAAELPSMTFWRYANGFLPTFGRWIVENPKLVMALAEDARAMAEQPEPAQPAEKAA